MAGNYYAYTCVYCSGEEYCSYRGEDFSSRICRKCRHYENNGNSDYADEDEYNEAYEEQMYYNSNEWREDNPDADDIADYYFDHD